MASKRMAKSEFHAIYTLLHDAIIKRGFVTLSGEVSLPFQWDAHADLVSVKYKKDNKECEVKCLLMNESMVINALHISELRTLELQIDHYVENFNSTDSSYDVKNVENLERKIYEDVLYPLFPGLRTASQSSQSDNAPATPPVNPDPLRDDRFNHRNRARPRIDPIDPFGVGAGDLDPFAGGPGMIMDPMRARPRRDMPGIPGMPGPNVWPPPPPGARFDPIGPGGRDPDNDDLLPPGRGAFDYDDMFM